MVLGLQYTTFGCQIGLFLSSQGHFKAPNQFFYQLPVHFVLEYCLDTFRHIFLPVGTLWNIYLEILSQMPKILQCLANSHRQSMPLCRCLACQCIQASAKFSSATKPVIFARYSFSSSSEYSYTDT